jgi:hypothetical protein
MARVNWDAVRNDYLYGAFLKDGDFRPYTNREIAAKHGCKENTLNIKVGREGWGDEKKKIWAEIAKRVHEEKQQGLADTVLGFDNTAFGIACNAVKVLEGKQYKKEKFVDGEGNEYFEYTLNQDISIIEIRRILESTEMAIRIRQSMMGDIRANAAEDSINELVRIIQMERLNTPDKVIDVRPSNRGRQPSPECIDV